MNRRPTLLAALALLGAMAAAPTVAAEGPESVQDLIFLGENRPIFLRLRMTLGDRPFRAAWMDSVRSMHAYLDRNADGKLTVGEADRGALATLVRVANGGTTAMPRGELDNHPKDGVVSIDELSDALRTALGPFRVEVGKLAGSKPDALFEHLDRDKDGRLTRPELGDAGGSLHRLDLDDDELIDGNEVDPFSMPGAPLQDDMIPGRRSRISAGPPVLELSPDDSTLRPVRLLLKRYDQAGDNKLSRAEFNVDPKAFEAADADGDKALDIEELRRFLARVTPDIELAIRIGADASTPSAVAVAGGGSKPLPPWARVKPLGGGDVEVAADEVRVEIHVDNGASGAAEARQSYMALFTAADSDNNGYVEKADLEKDKDHQSPLASLFEVLDRDADGKLYARELEDFVDRQAEAARDRMVLSASDQGRAIFAILDLNRDRRLGLREIRGTLDRITTWDRDGDGRITAEEIPHHYQFTIGRGHLAGPTHAPGVVVREMAAAVPEVAPAGPNWFRRMDRNRDGDISRREFLGPRAQFDRLDRDHDGLVDATEAGAATATAQAKAPK